jgi:hypothetical protein
VVAHAAGRPARINVTLRVGGAARETVLEAIADLAGLKVLHAWDGEAE